MAHVITNKCVKDFICVNACPSDAIHPTKEEKDADTVSQLYINPDDCLDCGGCVSVCANDAIYAEGDLPAEMTEFADKNAAHFK